MKKGMSAMMEGTAGEDCVSVTNISMVTSAIVHVSRFLSEAECLQFNGEFFFSLA